MINEMINNLFSGVITDIESFIQSDLFFVCSFVICLFLIVRAAKFIIEILNSAGSRQDRDEEEKERLI